MRLLLDTHVWLWMQTAPEKFSPRVRDVLADSGQELFLSAASSLEISIKYAIGKLPLPEPPNEYVPRRLTEDGILELPVHHRHALRVADLPLHHRDPFDRLLVAQAQIEDLPLMTADPQLEEYDLEIRGVT